MTRILPALGVIFLTTAPALAQDWDCSKAGVLPQQGNERADWTLNILWPKVRQFMRDKDADLKEYQPKLAGAQDALLKAQRAWIGYRDGHCASEGFEARGGSLEPLLVSSCKTRMTRNRIEELLQLMQEY